MHECLTRGKEGKGAKFFQVKTRGDVYKLKHMKFNLNKINHFITVRTVKDWNRFSEKLWSLLPVEILKTTGYSPGQFALVVAA